MNTDGHRLGTETDVPRIGDHYPCDPSDYSKTKPSMLVTMAKPLKREGRGAREGILVSAVSANSAFKIILSISGCAASFPTTVLGLARNTPPENLLYYARISNVTPWIGYLCPSVQSVVNKGLSLGCGKDASLNPWLRFFRGLRFCRGRAGFPARRCARGCR